MNDGRSLASAQGAVREGAQAIDNLLHLLGSRRVGPKAIGSALVDVRDNGPTLRAAIEELSRELSDLLIADDEARALARSLLRQASACVEQLLTELCAVKKVDLDARSRLAVENAVRSVIGELNGLVFLVDLLACAVTPRLVELDAHDVLEGNAITPGGAAWPPMRAADGVHDRATFLGDARLVGSFLMLALAIVEAATGFAPRVQASPLKGDRLRLRIAGGTTTAASRPPGEIKPWNRLLASVATQEGRDVAKVVARLAAIELSIEDEGRAIDLVLGAPLKA